MRFCLWLPLGSLSGSRPCLLYWKAAAGTRGGGKSLADGLKGASAAHGVRVAETRTRACEHIHRRVNETTALADPMALASERPEGNSTHLSRVPTHGN